MEQRKTISTLNYATTAIVAASTGMVLARPESPVVRRNNEYYSPSPALNSRYSVSPISSRDNSPFTGTRASVITPNSENPLNQTTGWVNNSPEKKSTPSYYREDTPLSSESVTSPETSGKKPRKLKRRRSSKTPPFFLWRGKSKSPPAEELPTTSSSPLPVHQEEHYHLYDVGTRVTRPTNPRHSIASINSISGNVPRTPLKRIFPPPQPQDSPRLITPNLLCQVESCSGTPSREQLLTQTLRRRTSDGSLSPTRSSGHRRNQSVPSFDNGNPNTPTPEDQTNGYAYDTPSRSDKPTVWLVNTPQEDKFGSQARRRLEFASHHARKSSASSSYLHRMSQTPPATIPERSDSLNWDSEDDPTYESMKMENTRRRKARISSLFDETDIEKAMVPDHKAAQTIVTVLSNKDSEDDLNWDEPISMSNGHPNIKYQLPSLKDNQDIHIPTRTTSLSRSKSVPPIRTESSPDRIQKHLSAPKECWDNDFEDEGSDIWKIPENITDAQDKLKGYLSNIRTFSSLIDDLKRFRESYPRSQRRPISRELLDEIDAMIEISTLDGFTPPPVSGPLPSPKKSNTSLASSQWSFEDRFASFTIDDERELPTPPPPPAMTDSNTLEVKDLQARRLLEKILGESEEARMEVRPEQLTKMIDYVTGLKDRCDEFDSLDGVQESWNIGLGVYV